MSTRFKASTNTPLEDELLYLRLHSIMERLVEDNLFNSDQEEFADVLLSHVAIELPLTIPLSNIGLAIWLLRTAVH